MKQVYGLEREHFPDLSDADWEAMANHVTNNPEVERAVADTVIENWDRAKFWMRRMKLIHAAKTN